MFGRKPWREDNPYKNERNPYRPKSWERGFNSANDENAIAPKEFTKEWYEGREAAKAICEHKMAMNGSCPQCVVCKGT